MPLNPCLHWVTVLKDTMCQCSCMRGDGLRRNSHFFESLNPLADFDEDKEQLERYLFQQSVKIEPRECDSLPAFKPTREYTLKSPGIKPPKHLASAVAAAANRHGKAGHSGGRDFGDPTEERRRGISITPGSPTSKDTDGNSDFALVVINPGHSPRYVSDLPSGHGLSHHRPRNFGTTSPLPGHSTSPPNPRSRSTPSPPGGGALSPFRSSGAPAPPLPPRSAAGHRPSPLPGPKPSPVHHMNRDKSGSPRSPLSPLQQGTSAASASQSSNFVFPPPLSSRRVTSPEAAAPPTGPKEENGGNISPPPAIPPRTPARNGKLGALPQPMAPTRLNTHSPLPPPLSPNAVQQAVNLGTPRVTENGQLVPGGSGGAMDTCIVGTPSRGNLAQSGGGSPRGAGTPPPLFPRRGAAREEITPPPRPPKRQSAPPLPPKTYKQRMS